MKKILVVDDDKDILNVVQQILVSHGFDVQTHSTGLNVPDIVFALPPQPYFIRYSFTRQIGD